MKTLDERKQEILLKMHQLIDLVDFDLDELQQSPTTSKDGNIRVSFFLFPFFPTSFTGLKLN